MKYELRIYNEKGRRVDLRDLDNLELFEFLKSAGINFPPIRKRLATTRNSITHKFDISGYEGYLTVGLYEDGKPGELFITMSKEGSTVGGMMDTFGTSISLCLQYGVPLKDLVRKFTHTRFEPHGYTNNPEIPIASSIVDYIFKWLGKTFLTEEEQREANILENNLETKLMEEH